MADNLGLGNPSDWYQNDLGRTGDAGGLDYWNQQLASGQDATSVHNNFMASAEAVNRRNAAAAVPAAPAAPADAPAGTGAVTPATTNVAQQYTDMGASDPTKANAALLTGNVTNPYLDQQANNIQTRLNRNLNENIMPGINQGATGAGQYGSSRQGIAQGKAIADTQDNYAGQMANLYGGAYTNAQNLMGQAAGNLSGIGANVAMNNTQQTNSTNLANQSQMQNFYLGNRQLDQSGLQLGANLYGMGNTGNTGAATQQTNLGNTYQNAPLTATQNYANTVSPYTGLGGSQSTTAQNGGGAVGAVGGAIAGSQVANNLGFGSGSTGGMAMTNGGGFANMPNYMIQN